MPIIPTGSPAWVRNVDHTIYGGDVNKTNWHSQGVTNPRTDVGAEQFCRITADLSAIVRTAAFCEMRVQCNDGGSPTNPTVQYVRMMTGDTAAPYPGGSPPSGFPTVTRISNGRFEITCAASYIDPYGATGTLDIQHVLPQPMGIVAQTAVYLVLDNNADFFNEAVLVSVFDVPAGTASVSPLVSIEFA